MTVDIFRGGHLWRPCTVFHNLQCHLPTLCAPQTGLGITFMPSQIPKCFTKPLKWRKRINGRQEKSWVREGERNKGWGMRDRKQGNDRWKLEEVGGFSASDWLPLWSQISSFLYLFYNPVLHCSNLHFLLWGNKYSDYMGHSWRLVLKIGAKIRAKPFIRYLPSYLPCQTSGTYTMTHK